MIRRLALLVATVAALAAVAPGAAAQAPLSIRLELPAPSARSTQGPTVTLSNLFTDQRSRELLESGFVARLDISVELWKSRTGFDEAIDHVSWRRLVQYDPVRKTYRVARVIATDSIAEEDPHVSLEELRTALAAPHRAAIVAPRRSSGLYYYATLTVESLNSDDLEEVRRWLSGEVRPTIRGKQGPVSFFRRTTGWIAARLFGGDVKRASISSELFSTT